MEAIAGATGACFAACGTDVGAGACDLSAQAIRSNASNPTDNDLLNLDLLAALA